MRELTSLDGVIKLQSVGVLLPCSSIYADVDFENDVDLQESS
jgi:hypothetical protein